MYYEKYDRLWHRSVSYTHLDVYKRQGVSSTKNGRDSNAQRLGTKMHAGQIAKPGNIIVRQRAVSYTHLDVYKRQALQKPAGFRMKDSRRRFHISSPELRSGS